MPLIPHHPHDDTPVEAPRQPHLALLSKDSGFMAWMAIPRESIIGIIIDPTDPVKGIFPLTFVHVGVKRLVFKCPCGSPACDRKVTFHGTWTGMHPRSKASY